jgi:trimeric autotransporter adhesin
MSLFTRTPWCRGLAAVSVLVALSLAPPLHAGFSGTDVYIPASARAAGVAPSQFYSTLWVTNLSTSASANVQLKFLQRDTSNTSPVTQAVTIAPGETKKYENVVQTVFGLPSASGAIRVQSDQEVLVSSRTYNLPPGSDIRDANGLFFTGIPQSLSIGFGETSQLQGVSQGGSEDFRYNFGMVETTGNAVTVRIVVRNSDGSVLGTKDYPVQAYEAKQYGIADAAPGISTANGRVEGSVVSGSGAVLLYATAVANGSQDSIGFEMSYKNTLLSAGVSSLNTFTGAVTIAAGSGISVSTSVGNQIVISATGGGGGGGGVAGVSSLNSLTGAVTLSAGSNVSITPSGNNLILASTAAGLTLPFTGSTTTGSGAGAFNVTTPGTASQSSAIVGAVTATSPGSFSAGVRGTNAGTGTTGTGVTGSHAGGGWGVYGVSATGWGVYGSSGANNGVYGASQTAEGVSGYSGADNAVTGYTNASTGAYGMYGRQGVASGLSDSNHRGGVWGDTTDGQGVLGTSRNNIGVSGMTNGATAYGVQAYTGGGASSYALAAFAYGSSTRAGYFYGSVNVTGSLSKGGGSFKIDHPLQPESKYLYHSFVESPDMMNIYNGVAVLDAKGEAAVALPAYFSALNRDFRYQLTCVGGYAPVYVSQEVTNNEFRIGGGRAGLKVSWQVTGIRQDAWANANRIPTEEVKEPAEQGFFLHPELHGQPEEKGISWAHNPEGMQQMKQLRERLAEQQK